MDTQPSETPLGPGSAPIPVGTTAKAPVPTSESAPVAARSTAIIEHQAERRRPRHWVVPVIVLVLIVAVGAAAASWFLLPPAIEVTSPIRGPAVDAVYATGSVEAPVTIPIAGRVTGHLAAILVDEGAEVAAGQLLVRYDDEDVQETIRQLTAQEVFAKQEYDRVAKLLESGSVAKAAYDRAYADWQAAKAATGNALAQANFLKLTAPSDGRIVKRDGEVGQLIPANQPVLWLVRNEPLRISSSVDEEDISEVKVGQEVLIRADAFPDKIFNGRVQSITPMGDAVARSYRVRIELDEQTPLLIGMTAETNIIIRKEDDALLLPTGAVQKDHVWRVVDGRLVQQKVTIGARGAERTEIRDGLGPDDQVALKPDQTFKEGLRVRARAAPSS